MKKEKQNYVIMLMMAGLLGSTYAQENDSTLTKELKEVMVSATRTEQKVEDVSRSVTVITSEELKKSIYNNVAELLSQQEGITIIGTGQTPGSLLGLYTRGANTNHTTILVDGIRITDPSTPDNSLDLSEISLINIDRIEIVRGSHGTMYGSSSIGGMINIITKKNQQPGFHGSIEAKGGTFGKSTSLLSENVFLNYTTPKGFYINTELLNANVKGLDATLDTVTNTSAFKNRDQDNFDKLDLAGKIGLKNTKTDLYLGYKSVDQTADIDDGAYDDDENSTLNFNRDLITYGASYKPNNKFIFQYTGGYSNMERVSTDDSSVVDIAGGTDKTFSEASYKGTLLTNELQANVILKGLRAVAGIGRYQETMSGETYFYSGLYGDYEFKSNLDSLDIHSGINNVFLRLDAQGSLLDTSLSPLQLGLGMRFSNHTSFGNNITYEINPAWRINDKTVVYGLYSTGFNAPSLYQLYSPSTDFMSGITRGNSLLKPETSASFEIGFKQQINTNLSLSVSYFNTVVQNNIDYVFLWDKNIGIDTLGNDWMRNDFRGDTYINMGKQTNRGLEFMVRSKLNDKVEIQANLTLVNGRVNFDPSNIDTSITKGHHVQLYNNGAFLTKEVEAVGLVRRPNTGNAAIIYMPIKKLMLRADLKYISSKSDIFYDSQLGPYGALNTLSVSEYVLFDAGVKYSFGKNASAAVRVENILDADYIEIKGYTSRGRSIYLNLAYTF